MTSALEPLWVGCMSGTSLDGADTVLTRWVNEGEHLRPDVLAHVHLPFGESLRAQLLALNTPGDNELHRAALAANALSRHLAQGIHGVLERAGVAASQVRAAGVHGQTVRHQPAAYDGTGYTLQLLNPALLAELTSVAVVCDLRSRDVAAGGQGAPLVPAFHAALWGLSDPPVAVLNVGGIANLTILSSSQLVGFDCGPGNVFMDAWCQAHTGAPYDQEGQWAQGGQVHAALLQHLLDEPFFDRAPPKSTGRDLFDPAWLASRLHRLPQPPAAQDVQATLCELTAVCAARALQRQAPNAQVLRVCGGGAYNLHLLKRLQAHLPGVEVETTSRAGVPADQVEALAFSWLARAFVREEPLDLRAVTGARGPRRLGAYYPA